MSNDNLSWLMASIVLCLILVSFSAGMIVGALAVKPIYRHTEEITQEVPHTHFNPFDRHAGASIAI